MIDTADPAATIQSTSTDGGQGAAGGRFTPRRAGARGAFRAEVGMFWMSRLERKDAPLAPRRVFLRRLGRNFLATLGIVGFSLGLGTLGYHYLGGVGWVDAFLNAAMILTGMGPVDRMEATAGKLFAAFYALYSGLAFLTMVAVLVTPVYHRFIHRFHLEGERG